MFLWVIIVLTSIWQCECAVALIPEKTALLIIPRRGLPLVECAHGKPCPMKVMSVNNESQNTCLQVNLWGCDGGFQAKI